MQIEYVTNGAKNRNRFIPATSVLDVDFINTPKLADVADCYTSIYLHSDDILKYLNEHNGSCQGYQGIVKAEFVHFDFDDTENPENSRKDTIDLIHGLIYSYDLSPDQFRVWFTGNKGFHVFMLFPDLKPSTDIPKRMRAFTKAIAGSLKTFDATPYDITRIWRIPNSKHSKTGLYCIPITWTELNTLTIDKIKELAKAQRKIEWLGISEFFSNKELLDLFYSVETTTKSEIKLLDGLNNGFKIGDRNNGLTSIAGLLRSKGFEYSFIRAALLAFNSYHGMNLDNGEIDSIAKSVQKYEPKIRVAGVSDIKHVSQSYAEWLMQQNNSARTKFGFKTINRTCGSFSKTEVFTIAARSGVGKTTMAINMLNNIAKAENKYCLFFSLEMSAMMVYQRMGVAYINKHYTLEGSMEDEDYFTRQVEAIKTNSNLIVSEYEKVLCVDKSKVTLENMAEYLLKARAEYGIIDLVAVDYIGYVHSTDGKSNYEKISAVARGMKEFAKDHETRVILLTQTSRAGEDGTEPVKLNHLRDSGAIEESADYILGLWDGDNMGERIIRGEVLKTRWALKNQQLSIKNNGLNFEEVQMIENPNHTKLSPLKNRYKGGSND